MKFEDVEPGMLIKNCKLDAIAWVKELYQHPEFGAVWCGYVLDGPPQFQVKFMWGAHVAWEDWSEVGGPSWCPRFRFKDVSLESE